MNFVGVPFDNPKTLSEKDEVARLLQKQKQLQKQVEDMQLRLLVNPENAVCENVLPLETRITEMQQKLEDKNQQLQPLESKVAEMNAKIVEQNKQIDVYTATIERSYNRALMTISALVYRTLNNQMNTLQSLSRQSSLTYFRYCVEKAKREFPDKMDFIHELIDISSVIAITSERETWKQRVDSVQIQVSYLDSENRSLLMLLHIMRTTTISPQPTTAAFHIHDRPMNQPTSVKLVTQQTLSISHSSQLGM